MELIGHRGCAGQYPENTLQAVRSASEHVDYVEIDLKRCGSGELVVFHDDNLDRLTTAEGKVGDTNWQDIQDLTVMGTNEPIPLLSTVLEATPDDTGVLIECKDRGLAEQAVPIAEQYPNETMFISFYPSDLRSVRDVSADVSLGYIYNQNPAQNLMTTRSLVNELGIDCVHVYHGFCLDREYTETLHRTGIDIHAGTIGSIEEANEFVDVLKRADVERLSTDRWDIIK